VLSGACFPYPKFMLQKIFLNNINQLQGQGFAFGHYFVSETGEKGETSKRDQQPILLPSKN